MLWRNPFGVHAFSSNDKQLQLSMLKVASYENLLYVISKSERHEERIHESRKKDQWVCARNGARSPAATGFSPSRVGPPRFFSALRSSRRAALSLCFCWRANSF